MMTMAQGFNNVINNSTNSTTALQKLSNGQLGQYLTPSAFNVSFVGPEGPVLFDQNGDMAIGNFHIYNLQNGTAVEIGNILAGNLNLTSAPIYHDGTTKVPAGVPPRASLNPGYSTSMSLAIVSIASFGTLMAIITIIIVLIYRKREVFKASSPLFCVLELIGFILSYISVFFFTGHRDRVDCIIIPITFHLGYSLILGNLIAKNYRVYRIFNNIFITRTVVTDLQLLKVSGGILAVDIILLSFWLSLSDIQAVKIPVSGVAYYASCSYHGATHPYFLWFLTIFAAGQLVFATFLAFKTRTVGKNYSKYSEYKQIGLSVYNIFFSGLIGFIIYYLPTTDYFTRHYLTATMIVWSSTFSLLTLFVPKLYRFFFTPKSSTNVIGKASDLTGRYRPPPDHYNASTIQAKLDQDSNYDKIEHQQEIEDSLDQMTSEACSSDPEDVLRQSHKPVLHKNHGRLDNPSELHGIQIEAHEARMPIQHVFRYLPFLAAWDMKNIILFPGHGYFSWISVSCLYILLFFITLIHILQERSNKGRVFGYSHASFASLSPEAFVVKVHGLGFYDVYIQVSDQNSLEQWCSWFNQKSASASHSASFITSQSHLVTQPYNSICDANDASRKMSHSNQSAIHPSDKYSSSYRRGSEATLRTIDCPEMSVLNRKESKSSQKTLCALAYPPNEFGLRRKNESIFPQQESTQRSPELCVLNEDAEESPFSHHLY
ncbi:7 transmembrane sweet-taste receptor of 3 GCPR-domain-containing protein [Spinellus fusiger]|nr:7 transmembrane sweet-taste receptor of 3 GCPR-domain-containing protein [Spinellus fusiger]